MPDRSGWSTKHGPFGGLPPVTQVSSRSDLVVTIAPAVILNPPPEEKPGGSGKRKSKRRGTQRPCCPLRARPWWRCSQESLPPFEGAVDLLRID